MAVRRRWLAATVLAVACGREVTPPIGRVSARPASTTPAPVMAQQSTQLNGCRPNPWPLPHEIERAARHDLPLAPPYSRDP